MEDKEDLIVGLIAIISILLIAWGVWIAGGNFQCGRKSNLMGIETKFDKFSGCYFKIDGQFIPEKTYRAGGRI